MKRVPASQRTRQTSTDVLAKGTGSDDPLSELIRLAVQGMIEEALEGAVRDLLGRDYYRHGTGTTGYRNGYRRGRVKTSEGEVRYSSPQVRDVDASSLKELRGLLKGRSEALERLAVEMYARGCSTREGGEIPGSPVAHAPGSLELGETPISLLPPVCANLNPGFSRSIISVKEHSVGGRLPGWRLAHPDPPQPHCRTRERKLRWAEGHGSAGLPGRACG